MSTLQVPSLGRIVIYKLANGAGECPAVIVRVWNDNCVNLRLLTDSSETPAWRASSVLGDGEYQWHWPKFVPPKVMNTGDEAQIAAMNKK